MCWLLRSYCSWSPGQNGQISLSRQCPFTPCLLSTLLHVPLVQEKVGMGFWSGQSTETSSCQLFWLSSCCVSGGLAWHTTVVLVTSWWKTLWNFVSGPSNAAKHHWAGHSFQWEIGEKKDQKHGIRMPFWPWNLGILFFECSGSLLNLWQFPLSHGAPN